DWAEENLSETYIQKVIKEEFMEELHSELSYYIEDLSGIELNKIMDSSDDISKIESISLLETQLKTYEREIYDLEILIYGFLEVNHFVSLYIWNSFQIGRASCRERG